MHPLPRWLRVVSKVSVFALSITSLRFVLFAQSIPSDQNDFFESHIRPVLTSECLACHNVKNRQGGLALDSRLGWQEGGDSGEVIFPGKPNDSLLIQVLRHAIPGQEMPSKAPKLDDETIDRFATWIQEGAIDPRLEPQSLTIAARPWPEVMADRAKWWCWQPLAAPTIKHRGSQAIDAWIMKRLAEERIHIAARAEREVLLRRLSYILRGLPPTAAEVRELQSPTSDWNNGEEWIDRFLDSPEFGETWARHWMDVIRYSETHGSEDDAYLPFAFRYRDYLIRAFRNDIPFDQMIREQIAGDIISPRWNREQDFNESIIGTAFWRMVEFNQTPVDVKREEIIVIDSQIDSFSKAFQGITISCARCHDHKFDPISDEDYYAIYGVLRSTRSGLRIIDSPEQFTRWNKDLQLTAKHAKEIAVPAWRQELTKWPDEFKQSIEWLQQNWKPDAKPQELDQLKPPNTWARQLLASLRNNQDNILRPLAQIALAPSNKQQGLWQALQKEFQHRYQQQNELPSHTKVLFDLTSGNFDDWRIVGAGVPNQPLQRAGDWAIFGGPPNPFGGLLEPGYHTNLLSDRHGGTLRSPDFLVEGEGMSLLVRGSGNARVRLVIENFQGDSLLFDTINPELRSNELQWIRMTIRPQWRGLRAHLECLTRDDKPYVGVQKNPANLEQTDGRSSFGIGKVVVHEHGESMPVKPVLPIEVVDAESFNIESLSTVLVSTTRTALTAWNEGNATDTQVRWLGFLIHKNLLQPVNELGESGSKLVAEYRKLEQQIPIARRAPGVFEDRCPVEQEFLPRGDHRNAQAKIPRRYMEVLHSNPSQYSNTESGRLQLANEITDPKNPLTARVYVNRVWHWMFGAGLVSTVDNFGRMGEAPSHPELLDQLAIEFMEDGWSTKKLIRKIALSETWQKSSTSSPEAMEKDPSNRLLSHANMRRLDAEAIRDTMLFLGGKLRKEDSGRGTLDFYRSVADPNKQAPPGPLDGDHRRTIFLEIRRNFPSDFLTAFDFPKPSVVAGKRSSTVVPVQSLALLNDPFTLLQAKEWAAHMMQSVPDPNDRATEMFLGLLGREPSQQEQRLVKEYLESFADSQGLEAWSGLAHAMFNWKEAIYLR